MIVLTAYAQFIPDRLADALAACETVRQASVLEPGCERYDYFVSGRVEGLVVFVEEWSSKEHLDRHFEQDAFREFFAAVQPMLSSPPEIKIFEASLL